MSMPEPSAGASAFPEFLDAFFAWYYQTFPVNATFIGVHDHDDRLPDFSEQGIGEALAAIDTLLARVRAFRHTTLTESQELDRRLVEGFLEIQRWEFRSAQSQSRPDRDREGGDRRQDRPPAAVPEPSAPLR